MSDRIRHGNLKKAIKEGHMFQEIAEKCLKQARDPFLFDCINVLTVNAAFACEVYLKAICIVERGEFYIGHFLRDQFDMISNTAQESIKADFKMNMENTSFEEALRLNSDAFDEWRYSFEENPGKKGAIVDIYGLITLMRCLGRYVDELMLEKS